MGMRDYWRWYWRRSDRVWARLKWASVRKGCIMTSEKRVPSVLAAGAVDEINKTGAEVPGTPGRISRQFTSSTLPKGIAQRFMG